MDCDAAHFAPVVGVLRRGMHRTATPTAGMPGGVFQSSVETKGVCFFISALHKWRQTAIDLLFLRTNQRLTEDGKHWQLKSEEGVLVGRDVVQGDGRLGFQGWKQAQHFLNQRRLGVSVGEVGMAAVTEEHNGIGDGGI